MEFVNEHITLAISGDTPFEFSYSFVSQDDTNVYVVFVLYANDCLFDLSERNYELKITVAKAFFEKYNESYEVSNGRFSVCCNTQSRLLEMIRCQLVGIQRKIFLESAILHLLYQLQRVKGVFVPDCSACTVFNNPAIVSKMQQARKFIMNNLAENLTIPIIAGVVGTNQCYLKKAFKQVFNQTIFEFIQENRMIKARHLLLNTQQNITEIAFEVGYSSLSSFSQAFKSYYGVSPVSHSRMNLSNN